MAGAGALGGRREPGEVSRTLWAMFRIGRHGGMMPSDQPSGKTWAGRGEAGSRRLGG